MKKAMKKAKEKAGRIVDSLRPSSSSRSQSPVPPDPDVVGGRPSTLSPKMQAETASQPQQTTSGPSVQIVSAPQSMPAEKGPILLARVLDTHDHANQQAGEAGLGTSSSGVGELSEVPSLPLSMPLGAHGPTMFNNNQNTTYNFGRDVINNNPVTVNNNPITNVVNNPVAIYLTEAEKDAVKLIKTAMGNRFVPAALHEMQSEDAGCMSGTRLRVLSMFVKWAQDDPMRIFWLAGLAGTGKTSIAVTLCRMLQNDPKVLFGGAFFCSRTANVTEQTDARCIIPTLVASLAVKSPGFASALKAELNTDSHAALKPISEQIITLLQQPLTTLSRLASPIVFVVDALDECSNDNDVKKLLQAISTLDCASMVKFILTSRPETHISTSPILSSDRNSVMRLHTIDPDEVTEDIRLYITDAFMKAPLAKPWYSEAEIKMLSVLSDGLFIFASTVIAYVLKVQSVKGRETRLRTALLAVQESRVAMGPLDAMYDFVLTRASDTAAIEPMELEVTLKALACILAARVPLSTGALADLLGLELDELLDSLQRLHALVHVPEEADQPSLRTLHASFGDYLLARNHISVSLGNETLARGCLNLMGRRLHFNISKIQSSYEPNSEVKPSSITLSLEYACMQWIYHIADMTIPTMLDADMGKMLRPRFLFWLEVMSLLDRVWRAAAMLQFASSTVRNVELSQFFRDARAFVTSSREAIEFSVSHIYLSALPFAANDSLVYTTFSPLCTGLAIVKTFGSDRHGDRTVLTLTGHTNSVNSVVYSPDNHIIASGSKDGGVRVWDTRSGEEMISPLVGDAGGVHSVAFAPNGKNLAAGTESGEIYIWDISITQPGSRQLSGHSERVTSVKFSPDGVFLASASYDDTVRLWRFGMGELVSVMVGHEGYVNAVEFSPDGDVLVSGSHDMTIRLWQTATGEPVGPPLEGHIDWIYDVSFSLDGERIVSGSADCDIRLWESRTGKCIATLSGHTDEVRSVRFSPGGRSLVSAADDNSVRLWTLGEDLGESSSIVLQGHSYTVHSVTFSPNGLYIASASADGTIRIWDAGSGQTAIQPLPAHDRGVNAVAVSADGGFIFSGSDDKSVRIWNAQTGEPKLPPLTGHTEPVGFVAISTDGRLIASASEDGTVRLWDAQKGDAIGEPLQGHEGRINAVQFSSDARWLVSGFHERTVRMWDVSTRQPSSVGPLHCDGWVLAVAFSPDHQLVAASDSRGRIYLWNRETGHLAHQPFQASNQTWSIAFSPAGTHLVSGGDDMVGRVWNIRTGEQVLTLEGHSDWIRSITFSPNGQFIVSGSYDCTIHLWDAATGAQLAILHGHNSYAMSVAFTPDGKSIVSGSLDSMIRVWDVEAALTQSSDSDNDPAMALEHSGLKYGWIVNKSGQKLLWVPAEYRNFLQTPTCTTLIGRHRVIVTAEETLHRGEKWTNCWRGSTTA